MSHPRALIFLFLTEMWERFGFYVVQGLLVLYMTQYFGFSDKQSYSILGVFTALAYLSPLAGGFIASRILGFKTSILWGGCFLIVGYSLLALPNAQFWLYPALAIIIIGNGLFKPNISSLLGLQYSTSGPERDAGFTLFYIGINLGALLAGLSSGYIKESFGWHTSFALSAIGLMIGLCIFLLGLKEIKTDSTFALSSSLTKFKVACACLLAVIALIFLLNIKILADWLLPCIGVIVLMFLVVLTYQQNPDYRKKMLILNILIISSIAYWMFFLQMFYSANLFIDRLVEKDFLGLRLTTTVFYASESVFIILLGPLFAWLWQTLHRKQINFSPVNKFSLGILFAGLGFLTLSLSTFFPNSESLINPAWVFCAYLFITIGELLVSPIGLSAVTLLAPPHLIGLMMGIWFVATGFGGIFAGMLAQLSDVPQNVQLISEKYAVYQHAFLTYAYFAFFIAILLFFVQLSLRRVISDTAK